MNIKKEFEYINNFFSKLSKEKLLNGLTECGLKITKEGNVMEYEPYENLVDIRTGEDMFFINYDEETNKIMCENLDGKIFWIDREYLTVKVNNINYKEM
jgi:hypothetical protein